jgi:hypothetical protein
MTSVEQARPYRSTALDRALASARTVVAIGPCEGLDEARIRDVLRAAESYGAESRFTVIPDAAATRWRYAHGVADTALSSRPDLATDDLAALVNEVNNRTGPRGAFEVMICGDNLLLDYSHGVGDGQLGVLALAVLAGGDAAQAPVIARGLSSRAVWSALWNHYRTHPAALRDFWRMRKANKRFDDSAAPQATRRIERWEDAKTSIAAHVEPAGVASHRAWAKENHPGATTASLTVAMWLAALETEGVRHDDRVMILMNCRRYLGEAYRTVQGNFAVGIPLPMPASRSPDEIADLTRRAIASGWPIAILGMAELKSLVHRPRAPEATEAVDVPDRLRLAVSDLGRLTMFDGQAWKPGSSPQLSAFLEPDGPDAVTLLVDELAGGRTYTASFCDKMIDPAIIERALDRMCDGPADLLANR